MSKNTHNLLKSLTLQSKDKKNLAQLIKVFNSFHDSPKTMKECDIETGVMRENICRFCAILRRYNLLFAVGRRKCQITKHWATIYTTNEDLMPECKQLKLTF